jgi:glycerol kinase
MSRHGLLTTICCDRKGAPAYALEGSVFVAGAALQWLRDGLGVLDTVAESDAVAAGVADTAGVYFVPAMAGLGAPYWDMSARGTITGLTRGATRAHLVRATLEALAYQTRDVVDAMHAEAAIRLMELRVDGGGAANEFLMQFQADLLGVPVDRPANLDTTAAGAAFLAGLGAGVWRTPEDVQSVCRRERRFLPRMSDIDRDRLHAGWLRAVRQARAV